MTPRTPSASVISLISPYLSRAQRARHSMNSSKSSVAIASLSVASPAAICSSDCELRKAYLASSVERRHVNFSLQRSSPVMSDSRVTVQSPTKAPSPRPAALARLARRLGLLHVLHALALRKVQVAAADVHPRLHRELVVGLALERSELVHLVVVVGELLAVLVEDRLHLGVAARSPRGRATTCPAWRSG